jgi:putative transposase
MKKKVTNELLDQLLEDYQRPEDLIGPGGLLAELTTHLGYDKNEKRPAGGTNARNGHSSRRLRSNDGDLEVNVPRDREGKFEPILVPKHQRHFDGFDDAILSLYSRGMATRDIQGHLEQVYNVEVSPTLISNVTNAVCEEVKEWQYRPLDPVYPIVYFDAIVVKVRDNGKVSNRAIYLALGVNMEGQKEVLGMWSSLNEGAKFWLNVLTELQNRGLRDIFFSCVDGLSGFPEALENVYPRTTVQLCIVHMLRNSFKFVGWKERKEVAAELKNIYTAATAEAAKTALVRFREIFDDRFPAIGKSWEAHGGNLIPFFDYPKEIRKVIYTANAIESLNSSFRKISRNRNLFPSSDAVCKLFYLAIKSISKKWTMPIRNWPAALSRFSIEFEGRMPNDNQSTGIS